MEGAMAEVLLNRNVPLIDEVSEFIELSGGPSLASILDGLRENIALQPGLTERQKNAAEQAAIRREILSYRVQYEEPAAAAIKQRKMESPRSAAAVLKLSNSIADKAFLDALDLDFSRLGMWPDVSSLALRVSPDLSADDVNKFVCAFIARDDHNIVVFYVGPYRPCMPGSGFYLFYDAQVNTLAAAPQLPSTVSLFSHRCIGSGAGVRRISRRGYIVVELLLRLGSNGLPTSNASLVSWWSGRVDLPPRWMENEVVLPRLPYPPDNGYAFHADTVFPVGDTCLCWADLTMGIIVCDLVDTCFVFIPLPEGLSGYPPLHGRGYPEEHRCMSCSPCANSVIRFVCLNKWTLTMWILDISDVKFVWKEILSFDIRSRVSVSSESWVSCPLLSVVEDGVIYVDINHRSTLGDRVTFYEDRAQIAPQTERVRHKIVTSSFFLKASSAF